MLLVGPTRVETHDPSDSVANQYGPAAMDQEADILSTASATAARVVSVPTSLFFVLANAPGGYWRSANRLPEALFNTAIALRWKRNTRSFARTLGYMPNLAEPRSFSEKIQWRKLFDRNPLFPLLSDKLAVRDFVRARAPNVAFPEIYWSGIDPEGIPFDDLRPPFVIKPNNRSGRVILVRDDRELDRTAVVCEARKWMRSRPHNWRFGEWAYGCTRSRIIVEEFLSTEDGTAPPPSFKILVFAGKVAYIYYSAGRRSNREPLRGFYTSDWQLLPVDKWRKKGRVVLQGGVARPDRLSDLIAAAEAIAAGIDHLRVDLYLIGDRIYFGETTIYNYSGLETWIPKTANGRTPLSRSFDDAIGALWTLPPLSLGEKLRHALLNSRDDRP